MVRSEGAAGDAGGERAEGAAEVNPARLRRSFGLIEALWIGRIAQAIFCAAGGNLLPALGMTACGVGDLRRDWYGGDAADAGDWAADGAGGEPGRGCKWNVSTEDAVGWWWYGLGGNRGVAGCGATAGVDAVWDAADRWGDLRGDGGNAAVGGAGGGIFAGLASFAD